MKAKLNERNEVVVTMSRGETQRVAMTAWNGDSCGQAELDCIEFGESLELLGIEFIFS